MKTNNLIKINSKDIHCLLIDLDDTLYPQNNGLWEMIRTRINTYMIDVLCFAPQDVPSLRDRLWRKYGTTLRGLQVEFSVDMDDYLAYVHDVPLENALAPDPELNTLLHNIPQRKVIFTNAHIAHAQRVTNMLGVGEHFEAIVDIYALAPFCKPQIEAFEITFDLIQETPEHCLLVDDNPINLTTAQLLGMWTVSVGVHRHNSSPHISTIHELRKFFTHSH